MIANHFSFSRRSVPVKGGSLQMDVGWRTSRMNLEKMKSMWKAFPDENNCRFQQRGNQSSMAPRRPRTVLYRARQTTDER